MPLEDVFLLFKVMSMESTKCTTNPRLRFTYRFVTPYQPIIDTCASEHSGRGE